MQHDCHLVTPQVMQHQFDWQRFVQQFVHELLIERLSSSVRR
jgi:hypothetical protein